MNLFARDGTVLFSDVASLRGRVVSPLADERLAAALWVATALGFLLVAGGMLGLVLIRGRWRRAPTASVTDAPPVIRSGLVQLSTDTGSILVRAGAVPGVAECWLTRREMEVLRMLATPRTYRQIAADLSLSEETVRSHVKSLLRKLNQPDRARRHRRARRGHPRENRS